MPLTVVGAHWSDEGYTDGNLDKTGAGGACGGATADNCFGKSGTIYDGLPNGFRADKQNASTTHQNIQIQKNGVGGKSTIGGVLFEKALKDKLGSTTAPGTAGVHAKLRRTELTKALHNALTQSVGTWTYVEAKPSYGRFRFYSITGSFTV